jgi:hypothetical protein
LLIIFLISWLDSELPNHTGISYTAHLPGRYCRDSNLFIYWKDKLTVHLKRNLGINGLKG